MAFILGRKSQGIKYSKMLPSSIDMDVKGRIEAIIVSDKFLPKDNGTKPK